MGGSQGGKDEFDVRRNFRTLKSFEDMNGKISEQR